MLNTDDCWLFAGFKSAKGYGMISNTTNGFHTTFLVHRLMYETYVGEIAPGYTIDHLCRVTSCINPQHLQQVTREVNAQLRYGINICKRGHKLTVENSYYSIKNKKNGRLGRQCQTCRILSDKARSLRKQLQKGNQ